MPANLARNSSARRVTWRGAAATPPLDPLSSRPWLAITSPLEGDLPMRCRSFAPALVLPLLLVGFPSLAEEEDMSAHGFDNMRIEQEEKLFVPPEIQDEVLAFLKHRYVDDKTRLAELAPNLSASFDVEDFTDIYYDSPSLQMLAKKSGVRHRKRVNLSRPEDVKSGRELMQIKLNDISSNALERGEIKYEIEYLQRPTTPEDTHPMLGKVKKQHRELFKKRLVDLGIDPQSMPRSTSRFLKSSRCCFFTFPSMGWVSSGVVGRWRYSISYLISPRSRALDEMSFSLICISSRPLFTSSGRLRLTRLRWRTPLFLASIWRLGES